MTTDALLAAAIVTYLVLLFVCLALLYAHGRRNTATLR